MSATLPCIGLTGRALRDVSDEALEALLAANGTAPRIFARGGAISRIRVDESGRPTIDQVDDHALRRELARAADFTRTKGGEEVTAHPPVEVVRDMRAHPDPPFPPLEGVVEVSRPATGRDDPRGRGV